MKNFKGLLVCAACCGALSLSGCARQPDQIAAAEIGPSAYDGYSCARLAAEKTEVAQALDNLSASQRAAASGDAWGVFLLGLPISSMSGNDQEAAIAIAKGRLQAIERSQDARGCR
jgi:hypothetical protein